MSQHSAINLIGEAANGKSAVETILRLKPEVVVLDVNMRDLNGVEVARQVKAQLPAIRIIGLSLDESAEASQAMLEAGAEVLVSKASAAANLIRAITKA